MILVFIGAERLVLVRQPCPTGLAQARGRDLGETGGAGGERRGQVRHGQLISVILAKAEPRRRVWPATANAAFFRGFPTAHDSI
jgi:hypothetical protein